MTMGERAHSAKCSNDMSGNPCKCTSCHGALHGWVGATQFSYLTLSPPVLTARRPALVRRARRQALKPLADDETFGARATAYVTTKLMTAALESEWPTSVRDAAMTALGDVFSQANTVMLNTAAQADGVGAARKTQLIAGITDGHVLCVLCAGTLRLIDRVKEVASSAAAAVADAAVDDLMAEMFPTVVDEQLRIVVRAVAKAGAEKLVAGVIGEDRVLALRLGGVMSCPDWSAHPGDGLWKFCVRPLFETLMSDEEKRWAKKELADLRF
jgi:hypothetical protein